MSHSAEHLPTYAEGDNGDGHGAVPEFEAHTSEGTPDAALPPVSQPQDEHDEAPQVAALRSMFPDFDSTVLQSVLESVDYNQDRAIDVLLGMSDPEYVSTAVSPPPEHDLALDEQLARQLALEDEQQAPRARGQAWPRRDDVPYEARHRTPGQPQQSQQQQQQQYVTGSERGDFQELQETLGRMAESGKRTFSSIVSKAKAKINEYNQQNNQPRPGQTSAQPTEQRWDAAPPTQLDRHTAAEAYSQQYYAQNRESTAPAARETRTPPLIILQDGRSSSNDYRQVTGYDVGPKLDSPLPSASATVRPSSPQNAVNRSSISSARPSGETPQRPLSASGNPIDGAKLGLLPKRAVSLINTSQVPHKSEEEDELEYVENPFEEGHN
ncbi:predicted protein [Postia placenta Mad-698-R]|nr:predicted protein [Postia placenta Mad-698-R]